ncbi:phage terminase small subunit P27 family [Planomicrobium chinense]|uniref:phage terminase small subunit P27 family n=1 Tax=Planococcus chinensis TaxID=272917 RepID=UPI001CC75C36|nr:phage terminase small subunit P27 family [Planococcus chinensis]MBZ5203208.1 phage terminase small subunit P27 family [Planococcus chinensis]
MARPKKLVDALNRNISKAEIEERRKEEESLEEFESISLTAPPWLEGDAKEEYERIIPLLKKLPIASLDLASVTMYCDFYAKYKEASQTVDIEGTVITQFDARGNEKRIVNPKYTVMGDAARMVRTLSGSLGMTIDSRMRIVVPKKEEVVDPFAEMMKDD